MAAHDTLRNLRLTASSALLGAAIAGIALHRFSVDFDPHIPGALLGGCIALLNWKHL